MGSILPHRGLPARGEPLDAMEKGVTERLIIVDHVLFVVEDYPASRRLYTAALAPLGIEELNEEPNCISYGREHLDDFSICEGSPVTTAAHVAFDAADRSQVDAFFEAALAAGATVRGEPGVWIQYSTATTARS